MWTSTSTSNVQEAVSEAQLNEYRKYRLQLKYESCMNLNSMNLEEIIPTITELLDSPISNYITLAANDCGYSGTAEDIIVNYVHPLFLKAKAAESSEENPNWRQEMNGQFADEYWDASVSEIETLESMKAWEVVDREYDMNVLRSTWAFKLKCYPDGLIKKFKDRFSARGDMQLEGIDFFDTYAPVVQWTTIRIILILEVLLGLKSKQGDVTAAFLHANLGKDKKVFVDMPRGFEVKGKNGKNKVLRLKKALYGLCQSPRDFWDYMMSKMELCGLVQSKMDPCLFIGKKVMAIIYVDDILFWAVNVNDIHDVAMELRKQGVDLEQ